jgi:hypothetical protein
MLSADGRKNTNSELHAFYADELFGAWRPHPKNPVKRAPLNAYGRSYGLIGGRQRKRRTSAD